MKELSFRLVLAMHMTQTYLKTRIRSEAKMNKQMQLKAKTPGELQIARKEFPFEVNLKSFLMSSLGHGISRKASTNSGDS